ncbi:hypothetical protein [Pseudonocardia yuanmonensis]|uniref:hypothetical protein n=1 Tax=Pseudonocardia yuanmonensis TaxID=1095914 RepID=UPI0031EB137B
MPTQVTTATGPNPATPRPRTPSGGVPTTAISPATGTAATSATIEEKTPDLTVNKVLAGAGAAATTAVFGSFFGATGTVAGAALGSVVTTLGTTIYQRSLDRTKETVLARVKIPGRKDAVVIAEPVDPLATIPLQRRTDEGGGPTMLQPALGDEAPEKTRPWYTRKRLLLAAASTVAAFVVGMVVITGVEWVKGSPISGGTSGTSVSRVVSGSPITPEDDTDGGGSTDTTETTTPTTSAEPTDEQDGSTERPGTEESTGSATATTTPRTGTPTRTTAPGAGSDSGSQTGDQQPTGRSGSGSGGENAGN